MDNPEDLRETLLQYRLHELPETERDEVDTLLITDPAFAEALQEAEYDLLDAYAAQELPPATRRRVEIALQPQSRFTPAASTPAPIARPTRSNRWQPALAVAATILVALSLTLIYRHTRTQSTEPQSAQATPTQNPALPTAPPPPSSSIAPPAHPTTTLAASILLPAATRSQSALPIHLSPGEPTLRFTWPLPPDQSSSATFQLQVLNDQGKILCTAPSSHRPHASSVDFQCPAAQISSGSDFARILLLPLNPDAPPLLEVSLAVSQK